MQCSYNLTERNKFKGVDGFMKMIVVIRKKVMRNILIVIGAIIAALLIMMEGKAIFTSVDNERTYMVIVIDDFGEGGKGTKDMLELDIPITAAIMPFGETAVKDAKMAEENGKEIIIHMPMEPEVGRASWLGKTPITANLSDEEVKKRTENAMTILANAKGMNNHMGSRIMQNEKIVGVVFQCLKDKEMFFLDSKTTQNSVADKVASEKGIELYSRDVFLDHVSTEANVEKSMEEAIKVSKKKGYSIVIGHVGAQGGDITVRGIKNKLSRLKEENIEVITMSQLREKFKDANK